MPRLDWKVVGIPGKVNFMRLSRYDGRTAKTFATNFKSGWHGVSICR